MNSYFLTFSILFSFFLSVDVDAAAKTSNSQEAMVDRERRRLEELFIWKMSEELKLPVELETSFAKAIRDLNRDKAKANSDIAKSLAAIEASQNLDSAKSRVALDRALKSYEKGWRTYGALPGREISRIRKILGSQRLGRYLILKSQMAEKLKALSTRESAE